jgi:nitroreductase
MKDNTGRLGLHGKEGRMDVYGAIKKRRSIRTYKDRKVPGNVLNRVLDAARRAPSARNRQEWRFIAVRDPEVRKKLTVAAHSQAFVAQAPVTLVFCANEGTDVMSCGQPTSSIDLSIAMSYATLAATAEGLGTCWLGSFDEGAVKEVLGIPAKARVVAVSPLGYAAEKPAARPRKKFSEVVSFEKW